MVTHALAAIAIAVFSGSEILGFQDEARELLGVQPGREYSLLSHAIVHTDWCHIVGNVLALELIGPFVEKWLGKLLYALAIPCITITGAQLSLGLVPEYWNTGDNPVGMSIITSALLASGIYLGTRNIISGKSDKIVQLVRNAKREWVSWAAVACTVAISTVLVWAESEVTVGPTRIGHTTGWVLGIMITVANAVLRTLRDVGRKEESDEE